MFSPVGSSNPAFSRQLAGQNLFGNSDSSGLRGSVKASSHSSSLQYKTSSSEQPSLHSSSVSQASPGEQAEQQLFHPVGELAKSANIAAHSANFRAQANVDSDRAAPEADPAKAGKTELEQQKQEQDQALISQLAARDREVRSHEQAHMAVGGAYAGAAKYQLQRGPDGVNYAVGGEVPIDVSKEASPEENIRKAQIVRRAALAPAEPSPQDRLVAAEASRMEMQARQDLALELRQEEASQEVNNHTEEIEAEATQNFSSKTMDKDKEQSGPTDSSSNTQHVAGRSSIGSRLQSGIDNTREIIISAGTLLDQFA